MEPSSSQVIEIGYDVFISFRGKDVRQSLLEDLKKKFRGTKLDVFVDERLEKGAEITTLLEKIERSQILVVIFSKHYASSIWCLDELARMIECKERSDKQILIPVFYKVRPSDVREKRGNYRSSLDKHKKMFKDKVQIWKSALEKAANLSGFQYPSDNIKSKAQLIEKIVDECVKRVQGNPEAVRTTTSMRKRVLYIVLFLVILISLCIFIYVRVKQ